MMRTFFLSTNACLTGKDFAGLPPSCRSYIVQNAPPESMQERGAGIIVRRKNARGMTEENGKLVAGIPLLIYLMAHSSVV